MSEEKKKKVIQVDELVIYANEVTVINPQVKEGSKKPWRPKRVKNIVDKHESTSVRDDLVGEIEDKYDREEGAQRRVRPFWM